MHKSKISIIVPVFNAEKHLKECVESILNQTYTNIEIILVNDGSTDDSLAVCKKLETESSLIKIINQKNKGVSSARNAGLLVAQGEYICFIDSDDYVSSNFCTDFIETFVEDIDMVVCSMQKFDSRGIYPIKNALNPGTYFKKDYDSYLVDNGTFSGFVFHSVCIGMYKKSIIEQYNLRFLEGLRYNEDGLFNTEYLLHSRCVAVIDKNNYYYRTNENSATNTVNLLSDAYLNAMNIVSAQLIKVYTECGITNKLTPQLAFRNATIAINTFYYLCRNAFSQITIYAYLKRNRDIIISVPRNNLPLNKKILTMLIKLKLFGMAKLFVKTIPLVKQIKNIFAI